MPNPRASDPPGDRPPSPPSLLRVARRRWLIVLVAVVATPAAAVLFATARPERFESSAVLLFRDPDFDQTLFGVETVVPRRDPEREAATNLGLLSLPAVADRTSEALGDQIGAAAVAEMVEVERGGDSDLVSVTASSGDPVEARLVANTFAEEFIAFRREADRAAIDAARDRIVGRLAREEAALDEEAAQDLRRQREQLDVLASLQTGNAEIVQRATDAAEPAAPGLARAGAMGLLGGLALALLAALAAERLDRRVRDASELADALGLPVLARVPESLALARVPQPFGALPGPEREAFRALRARLTYYSAEGAPRRLVVTSPGMGEGKTTVAWHLASAAAESGREVLLVEADLRRPAIAGDPAYFPHLRARPGLTEHLVSDCDVDEVIQRAHLRDPADDEGEPWLDVIPAGFEPPNPIALLESGRMARLLDLVADRYDLVVVDAPPLSVVADALPLMGTADGVIAVLRPGVTLRSALHQLADQLAAFDVAAAGTVINGLRGGQAESYAGSHPTGAGARG